MKFHPFLTRLLLATLAMMLLCGVGIVGLGWALSKHQNWCAHKLGRERADALYLRYVRTLGNLSPADGDGDGVPDRVENFVLTDPANAAQHPQYDFISERGMEVTSPNGDPADFLVRAGETRRLRVRLGYLGAPAPFARGMQLNVSANEPGLICLPNATPTFKQAIIPISTDGIMEFDFLYPEPRQESDPLPDLTIGAGPPGWTQPPAHFSVAATRMRQPPVACTVQKSEFRTFPGMESIRLSWPHVDGADYYYIEATRAEFEDEARQQWFPVARISAGDNSCELAYWLTGNTAPGHGGPPRFRMIPKEPIIRLPPLPQP